ncbi:MAG: efflux RND transporter periplasmic adaptor subunit [Candidatus Acidiferrales bacterium]
MKRRKKATFLFGITLVAVAFSAACAHRNVPAQTTPAIPVNLVAVKQEDVPVYSQWVGTLQGYINAQIRPQVSGYLIRQDYREGTAVTKDQVLFEIDPRPFQAVLDQARAQLAGDQAHLGEARLDVARDIPEAQVNAIPQSQMDDDRQALLAAQAAVQAGRATVEQAQLNLGYTKVRSIISGIAGIAVIQVGNLVNSTTVLTAVSQVNPIKVYFPVNEQDYMRMAASGAGSVAGFHHPLQMIFANGTTYRFPGHVLFADRQVDPQTGTISIVGAFPNPRDLLRPGQYVRIRALTEILKNALVVPQTAVTQLQSNSQIAVVGPGNVAHIRTVEVGATIGTMWVITKGLQPDERVVIDGAQGIRNGEKVTSGAAATQMKDH